MKRNENISRVYYEGVSLHLPHEHWLHFSMKVQGAEVGSRARKAVGTTDPALQETDFSESA